MSRTTQEALAQLFRKRKRPSPARLLVDGDRFAGRLLLAAGFAVVLSSCGSCPESVRRPEFLSGSGYVLTRCAYRIPDGTHYLESYFFSGVDETRDSSRLLEAFLRVASAQPSKDVADEARAEQSWACTYYLSPRSRESGLPELEVWDALRADGRLAVRVPGSEGGVLHYNTEKELASLLREGALSALEESLALREFPDRLPLSWHGAALARFARHGVFSAEGDAPRGAEERRRILRLALQELSRLDELEAVQRTAAELVPLYRDFSVDDRSRLLARDRIPERVLFLLDPASAGRRAALDELFTLSLEFGGGVSVFAAAARLLFPRDANPELYASRELAGTSDIVLLQRVLAGLSRAEYLDSFQGWELPPS